MAARRAAARAAAAAEAAPAAPPAPAPEPVPEPGPELKEPEKPSDKPVELDLKKDPKLQESPSKAVNFKERVIERIILCPGGQTSYMPPPQPPHGHCHCPPQPVSNKKKKKGRGKKKGGDDGPCKHPFCIVQRARNKPQGLPWASGMYMYQQGQRPRPPAVPNVVICQRPVICCCPKCTPSKKYCKCKGGDQLGNTTEQFLTFMNMVFAAANTINDYPDAF